MLTLNATRLQTNAINQVMARMPPKVIIYKKKSEMAFKGLLRWACIFFEGDPWQLIRNSLLIIKAITSENNGILEKSLNDLTDRNAWVFDPSAYKPTFLIFYKKMENPVHRGQDSPHHVRARPLRWSQRKLSSCLWIRSPSINSARLQDTRQEYPMISTHNDSIIQYTHYPRYVGPGKLWWYTVEWKKSWRKYRRKGV